MSSKDLQNQYVVEVHKCFSSLIDDFPNQPYHFKERPTNSSQKTPKKWSNIHLSKVVVEAGENLKKVIDCKNTTEISETRDRLVQLYKPPKNISSPHKIIEDASFS